MTRLSLLALTAFVVPLLAIARSDAGPNQPSADPVVPGEILVRFKDGATPAVAELGRGSAYNDTLDVWRIDVNKDDAEDVAHALAEDPTVELVQPQYRYQRAAEPDDPLYASKQHVHYRTINLQAAWAAGIPPDAVTVAVVDGGVDIDHPELAGTIWTNPDEVLNGADDDTNGCIDDLHGCSYQSFVPDGDIQDADGHGTFVSGIIAAESDNGEGIAGIAQNAAIMGVRALDADGAGTTEQLAGSILYAARNGADVLNLSLVLPPIGGTCPTDALVEAALQEAVEVNGATVVAAAGNFGIDCVGFPASSQYAIGVGGAGPAESSDSHAPFAQWGPEVDVAAPAIGLVSTCPVPTTDPTAYCPGAAYGEGDGTSFSTPIASGVAALVLGADSSLTPADVEQRMRDAARNVPDENRPNWDGAGIIDAGAAIGQGSVLSSVDLRGDDLATAAARILVGSPESPDCEAEIWVTPDFHASMTASTAGIGECVAFWPPAPGQPWQLRVLSTGDKANVVNRWTVQSGGLSCSAVAMPLTAPVGTEVLATIDCSRTGVVDNDEVDLAKVVARDPPRRYQQDVRYATASGEPPTACALSVSRTVWFRVPSEGFPMALAVDTFGTAFETVLSVYRDDGTTLTEVACNDDAVFGGSVSRTVWIGDGVSDYVVRAAALGSVPAEVLRVNFSEVHVPANDAATAPVQLAPDGEVFVQPAHSASADAGDPDLSCAGSYGSTLWFTVIAAVTGPMTARTTGATYDTVLGVYDGATPVACNDEEGGGLHTSKATWAAEGGKLYTIVVGSYLGRPAGVLRMQVSGVP